MKFATYTALLGVTSGALWDKDDATKAYLGGDCIQGLDVAFCITPLSLEIGPMGSKFPTLFTKDQLTCATWTENNV